MGEMNEKLIHAMKQSGKTTYEICKATGLDKGAMSRFLAGTTDLRLESANKLADFLGLELTAKKKGKRRAK